MNEATETFRQKTDEGVAHSDRSLFRLLQATASARFLKSKPIATVVAVIAITLVVTFFHLGGSRTFISHEAYLAVTAREMLTTGDWIIPRFGGIPRLQKPPLGYWSAAICGWIGGGVNETTARLPAAISSVLLVLLIGVWAAKWYGPRAGLCAALLHSTAVHYLLHAREATVDMLLCLIMTAAMYLIATQPENETRQKSRWRWVGIYGLLGLSWLAKFHYGPVLVLAPCIVYWLIEKRLSTPTPIIGKGYEGSSFFSRVRNLFNPLGLLLFALIALPWPLAVLNQLPNAWDVWRHETVGRALGEMKDEPFWYFAIVILWITLPWTPLLLLSLRDVVRRGWQNTDSRERFLWIWIVVQVAIMSLSSSKHRNYIIPVMPAVSLLCGAYLARSYDRLHRFRFAAAWGLGVYVAGVLVVFGLILPRRDNRLPVAEFAQQMRRDVLKDDLVCVYGQGESPVVFYLGLPLCREETTDGVHARVKRDGELYVVTTQKHLAWILPLGKPVLIRELDTHHPAWTERTPPLALVKLENVAPAP